MLKQVTGIATLGLISFVLLGCDVDKVEDGRLPDVEVSVDPGKLPDYDVEGPDVDVSTKEQEITVPKVDIETKESTIEVPTVDIDVPEE